MSETDEIRLTRKEWEIVEEQCKKCMLWSNLYGCKLPDAPDSQPVMDCLELIQKD